MGRNKQWCIAIGAVVAITLFLAFMYYTRSYPLSQGVLD